MRSDFRLYPARLRRWRLSAIRAALLGTALSLTLPGCAIFQKSWPPEGRGQFAEQFDNEDERANAIEARLTRLEAKGASVHAAGELDEAKLLLVRIKRQVAAGLALDAEDDMDRMDRVLAKMEQRLSGKRRTR